MPYQASISVPMAVPPPSRSMAVFVWMLMMRYVPGAVLKGAIVEADAASNTVDDVDTAADEVDDGGEEDVEVVEVVVGYGPWVVVCCCCGVSMVELESELELELELELRLKLKLAMAGRSAADDCDVLRDASPPPNPPPNAAPITSNRSAKTIQNICVGSPHMRGSSGVWGC